MSQYGMTDALICSWYIRSTLEVQATRDIHYNPSDHRKDNSSQDYTADCALMGGSRKTREEPNFVFTNYSLMSFCALLLAVCLRTKQ